MVRSAHQAPPTSPILNAKCDPRVRFEDPRQYYTIDNAQVNDFLNIEEREDAINRCRDLYQLNLEVDPEGRGEFWRNDWRELAAEIRRNERVLNVLRSNDGEPVLLDESFDIDSDTDMLSLRPSTVENLDFFVKLLCWMMFFFFSIVFGGFYHYRNSIRE